MAIEGMYIPPGPVKELKDSDWVRKDGAEFYYIKFCRDGVSVDVCVSSDRIDEAVEAVARIYSRLTHGNMSLS